jgi:hypothetical protein
MEFRQELKFRLNARDYTLIKMRLDAVMKKDPHVNSKGYYLIRSLYFDDIWNTAYNLKMYGIKEREKYRIRTYNHTEDIIHLERKRKSGEYISKQSTVLTKTEVQKILSGQYNFLQETDDALKNIFYYQLTSRHLRPRVIVEFDREPFIFESGEVRITLDKNIRAGTLGFNLFDWEMPMINVEDQTSALMEVKYTSFLPSHIRKLLPARSADFTAFSKYILACDCMPYHIQSNLK